MYTILNITNGDSAVEVMRQANIEGDYLPWRDVLHAGPVPETSSLAELSTLRAEFIADCGWGSQNSLQKDFQDRDRCLQGHKQYQKVILWFEHDLYDQLQLLQLLDWFASQKVPDNHLYLICVDQYLGPMSADEMKGLKGTEKLVTKTQLQLGQQAWAAFRRANPTAWQSLLQKDTTELPFLDGAVQRMIEEYPSSFNGLSRTAQQALQLIAEQPMPAGILFGRYQDTEERRFLGDSSFWVILNQMLAAKPAVISLSQGDSLQLPSKPEQIISITDSGRDLLSGKINWLDIYPFDFWLGGVHLSRSQPQNTWQRCDQNNELALRSK